MRFRYRSRKKKSRIPSGELLEPPKFSSSAPTKLAQSKLSAAELLSLVYRLCDQNAQWDVILAALNPTNDAEVQRPLIAIRGPQMFVPHLELCAVEDDGKLALASCLNADALAVLHEAARSEDPPARY